MGYPYDSGGVRRNTSETVRVQQVRGDTAVVNDIVDVTVRDVRQRVDEARDLVAGQIAAGRATLDAAVADIAAARAAANQLASDVAAARAIVNQLAADAAQARGVYQTLNLRFNAIDARDAAIEARLGALETSP